MIVRIDNNNNYVLSENVNVAMQHFPNNNVINVQNINHAPIRINPRDGIVYIFTHGDENTVGFYDVNSLSNLFENPAGKTFVLISCKSGINRSITGTFAENFAKKNHCRVLAPMGCSVFSENGVAVIPESEVNKYIELQQAFEDAVIQLRDVPNKMFNACFNDDKCFAVKWNVLNSIDQLKGYGFLDIDARP